MAKKGRTVAVRITADTKGLVAGITKAEVNLNNLKKTAVAGTAVLAKMAAAGAGAAAGALAAMYARTAPLIDAQAKLADQFHLSTEAIGGLDLQFRLMGVSTDKVKDVLKDMNINLGDAIREGGTAAEKFTDLGLSIDELSKLPADKQFGMIADAIKNLGSASKQASAANQIFGESGIDVLNIIRGGSAAMEESRRKAEAYGTALSRVDAAKVEAANVAFEEAQEAARGLANRITVKLAPIVEALLKQFSALSEETFGFGDSVEKGFSLGVKIVGFFADTIQGLRVVFKGAELAVFTLEASIVEVFRAATHTIAMSLEGWLDLFDVAIKKINKSFGTSFATFEFNAADSPFVKAMDEMSEASRLHIQDLADELKALAMQEMPSDKIEAFMAKVEEVSQKSAENVAKTRQAMLGGGEDGEEVDKKTQEEFEKFQKANQGKAAAELDSLKERLDNLSDFHKKGLMSNKQYWAGMANATTGALANLTAAGAQSNKKMFELNKIAGIANATVATAQGIAEAWKLGPILGPIMAPIVAAAGAAQIQAIRKTQFGGGTAPSAANTPTTPVAPPVGASGAAGGAGGAGPAAGQTLFVEGVDPSSLFSGSMVRELMQKIDEHRRDGGDVVFA